MGGRAERSLAEKMPIKAGSYGIDPVGKCHQESPAHSLEMTAARERACWTCRDYGFKPGNPVGWRWACCEKRRFWFESDLEATGLRKGCEDWS